MATVDRRTFVGAAAALAAATALPTLAFGQDAATPGAPGVAPSALADLGLPVIAATIANDGITIDSAATAGTTLLTVSNGTEGYASFLLVQPPDGITEDDITAASSPDSPMPDWLHDAVVTGSLDLEPGQAASVGIELTAGEWFAVNVGEFPSFTNVTVTGEFEEIAIEADVAVLMHHHRFEMPAEIASGSQVWQITNEDEVLHHTILFTYPEAIDADQVLALLAAAEGMASPPAGLDPMLIMPAGYTGLQSFGVTIWNGFDLAPGHYQAVCFITDPGSDVPHVMEGMIATFTVA